MKNRRVGFAVGGFLVIGASLGPARAAPPDSQSQTWHILVPACTVTQSWAQDPTAMTATKITASVRVACADPRTKFVARLAFANNVRLIGSRDYGAGPFGQDPGPGPFVATITDTLPGRHLYTSTLTLTIWDWAGNLPAVGPPQCISNGDLACTFVQAFPGLVPRPLSTRPAKPTPASFHRTGTVGGQPCAWDVVVKKNATGVLNFTGRQTCIGDGTITLLADAEGNVPLTSASYKALKCDPESLQEQIDHALGCGDACGGGPHCYYPPGPYGATGKLPVAAPGQTFTVAYETIAYADSWSPPGDCIKYDGPPKICTFYFNVVVAG